MSSSIADRVSEHLEETAGLYHRLLLVVGPPRSGKTTALRALAEDRDWRLLNVNLDLSSRLLEFTARQRALQINRILDDIVDAAGGDTIALDNIEILFSPHLKQDPLRLLQSLSRNRTVIAAWPGSLDGETLTYAEPSHDEFRRYPKPDAVIVTTEECSADASASDD